MFAPARQPQQSKACDFQQALAANAACTPDVNSQAFPQAAQHNCLAASTVLKRKGNGLPSATATYTALRKAALGGSLLPEYGPTADQPSSNLHHNTQQAGAQPVHDAAYVALGQQSGHAQAFQPDTDLQWLWHEAQAALLEDGPPPLVATQHQGPDQAPPELQSNLSYTNSVHPHQIGHAVQHARVDSGSHQQHQALQQVIPAVSQSQAPALPAGCAESIGQQQQEQPAAQYGRQQQQQQLLQQQQQVQQPAQPVRRTQSTAQFKQFAQHAKHARQRQQVQNTDSFGRALQRFGSVAASQGDKGTTQRSAARSVQPMVGETTLNMLQLSKIIKHLQAQLDQQEEEGTQLREDLAAACEQIEVLQCDTADHPEALDQARAEGIELGSKQIAQERLLKHELQRALDRRKHMQQVAQDQHAAAAVEAAAHVASLQQHIQDLKVQNVATLESKLKADRRNMALQRQVDSLKQSMQLSERALLASQEEAAALEDRLHVLRRVNSQLSKSEALALQGVTNAQQQVDVIDRERSLLMTMVHEQIECSRDRTMRTVDQYSVPQANAHAHCRTERLQHHARKTTAAQQEKRPSSRFNSIVTKETQPTGTWEEAQELDLDVDKTLQPNRQSTNDQYMYTTAGASPDISSRVRQIADSLDAAVPPHSNADVVMGHASQDSQHPAHVPTRHAQAKFSQGARVAEGSNGFNMQDSQWQDKTKLVPNLSACIQEVKLLRESLSNTSILSQD